jgi:hypothetical protein
MFSSIDIDKKVSRKDRELAIRLVFSKNTVTNEVVKYYAKNDLFLAASYNDMKNQLRTCLKCLKKLTYCGSIGTEQGYSYGADLLAKHRRKFMKEAQILCTCWTKSSRTSSPDSAPSIAIGT